MLFSGFRQLAIGLGAAAVTFLIGSIIGVGAGTDPMGDATVLRERLTGEGLDPGAWSNGPGDRYAAHDHAYDKVIVVASGSITFGLADDPWSSRPATGSSCRRGPRTTRSSDRTGSCAWRRTCPPAR